MRKIEIFAALFSGLMCGGPAWTNDVLPPPRFERIDGVMADVLIFNKVEAVDAKAKTLVLSHRAPRVVPTVRTIQRKVTVEVDGKPVEKLEDIVVQEFIAVLGNNTLGWRLGESVKFFNGNGEPIAHEEALEKLKPGETLATAYADGFAEGWKGMLRPRSLVMTCAECMGPAHPVLQMGPPGSEVTPPTALDVAAAKPGRPRRPAKPGASPTPSGAPTVEVTVVTPKPGEKSAKKSRSKSSKGKDGEDGKPVSVVINNPPSDSPNVPAPKSPKRPRPTPKPAKPTPDAPEPPEETVVEPKSRPVVGMMRAINAARADKGLEPIQLFTRVMTAAQNHADNMASQKTVANELDDANANDRMVAARVAKIPGAEWGENVGKDKSGAALVKKWLEDPNSVEAQNIFNPKFKRGGIGSADAGDGELYFDVLFLQRASEVD